MNQKLSDWASIAEIVSGIAVVITLVFLVLSIRTNTEATRAESYENNLDDMNAFQFSILNNPDLFRVWEAWRNDEAETLESADSRRLDVLLAIQLRIVESMYFDYQYGLIGEQEWARLSGSVCGVFGTIEAASRRTTSLSREFSQYVSQQCLVSPVSSE